MAHRLGQARRIGDAPHAGRAGSDGGLDVGREAAPARSPPMGPARRSCAVGAPPGRASVRRAESLSCTCAREANGGTAVTRPARRRRGSWCESTVTCSCVGKITSTCDLVATSSRWSNQTRGACPKSGTRCSVRTWRVKRARHNGIGDRGGDLVPQLVQPRGHLPGGEAGALGQQDAHASKYRVICIRWIQTCHDSASWSIAVAFIVRNDVMYVIMKQNMQDRPKPRGRAGAGAGVEPVARRRSVRNRNG